MSQKKTWEISGLSLDLDLENADVMERYEQAFEKMSAEEKALPKDGKKSDWIRAYCKLYRDLYDRIFGEQISDKIFADVPVSAAEYEEIYDQFLTFVRGQIVASAERRAERLSKYFPNRAQKRAAEKSRK